MLKRVALLNLITVKARVYDSHHFIIKLITELLYTIDGSVIIKTALYCNYDSKMSPLA